MNTPHLTGEISANVLKSIIERVERLEEEKAGLQQDIRDILKEAQGRGFDIKALRQVIKIRKMDAKDRAYQEELLETYLSALGMSSDLAA